MANRRMLSQEIVSSDAFLDMPISSQALYFHLSINADDDGFIDSPKKIMRLTNTQSDDLRVLLSKKFILQMDKGIIVVKHWRINNFIRKDIYKETKYPELKKRLYIKKNGAYTLNPEGAKPVPDGHFQLEKTYVNATLTKRQHSIGKDSIDKVSIDKTSKKDLEKMNKKIKEGKEILKSKMLLK